MSLYKFKATAVTDIEASSGGRFIYVELDMNSPQAKSAFLTLAGDCRGNELGEWMEELGYTIEEIDPEFVVAETEPEDTDRYDIADRSLK